jgi:uncharacterized OB-fold protein
MRYSCPRCGTIYTVKPPAGTCAQCEATLVPASESHENERHGDEPATPKHKL